MRRAAIIPALDEQIELVEERCDASSPKRSSHFHFLPDRQGIGVRSAEPRAALHETADGIWRTHM